MPLWTDILTEITGFVAAYDVLIIAGAVAGLLFWGLKRFTKAGR